MRCRICDVALTTPNFSSDHDEYDPCETCLAVIKDTLEGYDDVASVDEDTFVGLGDASDVLLASWLEDEDQE